MSFYPPKISEKFYAATNAGRCARANAVGAGAAFICGSFVRFYAVIDAESKITTEVTFETNGCGYLIAAAQIVTEKAVGRGIAEMTPQNLPREIEADTEVFPAEREHCLRACVEAWRTLLTDFRARQIEEFTGEKALICTCFGVAEETVERLIEERHLITVEEVGEFCNAGTGCGSCQFLITELLNQHGEEF